MALKADVDKNADWFTLEVFRNNNMDIADFSVSCKFSEKPKYDCQVAKPNAFSLDWVYSVPCGENPKTCLGYFQLFLRKRLRGVRRRKRGQEAFVESRMV